MQNLVRAVSSMASVVTIVAAGLATVLPAAASAPTNCMLLDPPVSLTSNLSSKEEALRNDHIVDCQKGKMDGPATLNGAFSKEISTPGDVPDGGPLDGVASVRN